MEVMALWELEGRYLWVSTRGTQFTAQSPQRKQFAGRRILYACDKADLHRYVAE